MSDAVEMIETFRNSREGVLSSCQSYARSAYSLVYDYVRSNDLNKIPYELEMVIDLTSKIDENIDDVLEMRNSGKN